MNPNLGKKDKRRKRVTEAFLALAGCAVLAAIFTQLIRQISRNTKVIKAQTEIQNIAAAITAYQSTYGGFPSAWGTNDFTFGSFTTSGSVNRITNTIGRQAHNSEVMSVLMDLIRFGNGSNTANSNHCLNPQRTVFLYAKQVDSTNLPGFGPDGVYRDPWGNPYIISIDLNGDGRCRDAFYLLASVCEIDSSPIGLMKLRRPTAPPYSNAEASNSFEAPVRVMVWSLGPDGKADSSKKADEGVNKDNIISW